MIICGIDYSINSPAVVKFHLGEYFNILEKNYLTFTTTKKYAYQDHLSTIIHFRKDDFNTDLEQYTWIRDKILEFIGVNAEYVAFEGYAFNATGQVFNIAEATSSIKVALYDKKVPIRIYDPASIKMYATTIGNADKIRMEENFEKLPVQDRFDLSHLPMVYDHKTGNPKDNIVDAFFVCNLLLTELKLRYGQINMKDCGPEVIRIFNRVTKSNPVNILDTPFIVKTIK